MSLPVCPNCSTVDNVEPDARQQGANRCRSCGHVAMVVEFHNGKILQHSTTIRQGFTGLDALTKPRKSHQPSRHYDRPVRKPARMYWLDN